MNWEQRCIRLCTAVLVFAVVLRLWSMGTLTPVGQALQSPQAASFLMYLHTGRVVRQMPEPTAPHRVPETKPLPSPQIPQFTAADLSGIAVDNNCGQNPDLASLLTQNLSWNLTAPGPRVLILHSHTTESYTQTTDNAYEESSEYRTLDAGHNMIAIGKILADILEEAGIEVIHDTTLHDYPSYNGSYSHAAVSTKSYLEAYPTIELVLDLHRDAADTVSGQLVTQCSIGGETSAQLMFVMGTDTRLSHPDWERNLSLALKLQVLLERENPGICRSMNLSRNRYNQHLGDRALLIEVGAAGNTQAQAELAARELGKAIVALAGI